MKTSEAFRLTKERLWNGQSRADLSAHEKYICSASVVAGVGDIVNPVVRRLMDSEGTSYTLEDWLIEVHGIEEADWVRNNSRMQITRHVWVDSLIAHYQSLGD